MSKIDLFNGTARGSYQKIQLKSKPVWRAAKDLKIGDKIITKDGSVATVTSLSPVKELQTVYNFAVKDDHTYFVGNGPGILVHNTYGAAEHDSLARKLKAAEVSEKYQVQAGETPLESLKFSEGTIIGFLDLVDGQDLTQIKAWQQKALQDLVELRSYSVRQDGVTDFGFLNKTQANTLNALFSNDNFSDIKAFSSARRSYSDYVEQNPLLQQSLTTLYSSGGAVNGTGYFEFQNGVIDNFVRGEAFSSSGSEATDLRRVLYELQSGQKMAYQQLVGGLFQGASPALANNIDSAISMAAAGNVASLAESMLTAGAVVKTLRKGAFLRKTASGDKILSPSLAQQKALSLFAAEERAKLMDFSTFKGMLSKPEQAAIQKHPFLANVYFGTHLEGRVARRILGAQKQSPGGVLDDLVWTGRGNAPNDFIGSNGTRFDLTTNNPRTVASHQNRSAVDYVVTYDSLPKSFGYDFKKFLGR